MSLRIQNNVEAFNAHRNLVGTSAQLSKSMERLSSGYRINRAADDSAGLAISEKLRAQIGGLQQAQRNGQDAISLVQTAEGAMAEVHAMLQRVRDLAVQFNNGTLSTSDKSSISSEVAHALEHGVHLGHRALTSLHQRHRVLRVALSLVEATDLGAQLLADRQAGGVVGGAVDPVAGRQPLHRLGKRRARAHQVAVRVERLDVVLDPKGHCFLLEDWGPARPASLRAVAQRLPPVRTRSNRPTTVVL